MSIQRHPLQFPIERINDLNKHAYMATAYSFVSEDGSEYVLAGPNPMAAYQKAVEVYGEHARNGTSSTRCPALWVAATSRRTWWPRASPAT